jgi:hypothetical protein
MNTTKLPRLIIIDDNVERRVLFYRFFRLQRRCFRKVVAFNSFDTFFSDTYLLEGFNVVIVNLNLRMGIESPKGIRILRKIWPNSALVIGMSPRRRAPLKRDRFDMGISTEESVERILDLISQRVLGS